MTDRDTKLRTTIESLCTYLDESVEELLEESRTCHSLGQFEAAQSMFERADEREKAVAAARALLLEERTRRGAR